MPIEFYGATGFFPEIGYGLDLSNVRPFRKDRKMADKGKSLKKPSQSLKERRAEKRQKQIEGTEFIKKRKRY
ncbi:hypothetical protein ACIBED_12245 [Rhodococcus coprophilus]|nr:hypothetical protein [Rhodococcus coprophilus]MBM7458045.1 hypothetical protein [Rhodococcus coprophilus]